LLTDTLSLFTFSGSYFLVICWLTGSGASNTVRRKRLLCFWVSLKVVSFHK